MSGTPVLLQQQTSGQRIVSINRGVKTYPFRLLNAFFVTAFDGHVFGIFGGAVGNSIEETKEN